MTMDDTRIDAAPTPAHVFAYRAFRGIFVGSPESSPVRSAEEPHNINSNNKENPRHTTTRPSRFTTSPLRAKRDADLAAETLNLTLTPKKQCVNPVSPTKSILKKSNVPTPRRAGLRDVTVTFKDVMMSASPVSLRKTRGGSPVKVRSQPIELKGAAVTLAGIGGEAPVLRPKSTNWMGSIPLLDKDENQKHRTLEDSGFDLEGYILKTEKEMRGLIRYGQKWREQAKKQEEEISKLKAQLEELQKENDRLRPRDLGISQPARLSISMDITDPSKKTVSKTEEPKQRTRSSQAENQIRRPSQDKWRVPFDDIDTKKHRATLSSAVEGAQKSKELRPHASKVAQKESKEMPPSSKTVINEPSRRSSYNFNLSEHHEPKIMTKTESRPQAEPHAQPVLRQPSQDRQLDQVRLFSEPTNTTEPQSEEARKAAARERLRLKREAKVAGVRASSAPVVQAQLGTRGGSSRRDMRGHADGMGVVVGENEESLVDWMAIT